jgi:hypothetical protein
VAQIDKTEIDCDLFAVDARLGISQFIRQLTSPYHPCG